MTKPKGSQLNITGGAPVLAAGQWPKSEPRVCNSTQTKPYTAPELRPFAGRPGSLDFLKWPSRMGDKLVHRGEVMA